jgi:hypothetical protein
MKTYAKMEGFSFVTPKTSFNIPNTGKEDDDISSLLQYIENFPYNIYKVLQSSI